MRSLVRQFCALAGLTALEALRRPICLLLTTTCVVFTGLIPLLLVFQFGEEGKLVRDSSFALQLLFGLLLAGYTACTSLTREVRTGTASAVLSKPVGREMFFLAKFCGVVVVVLAFSACATSSVLIGMKIGAESYVTDWLTTGMFFAAPLLAFLIALLGNYSMKRPFVSNAFGLLLATLLIALVIVAMLDNTVGTPDYAIQWRVLPACLLNTIALMVIAAIAMSLATRLNTTPTLIICGMIFLAGLVSDHFLGKLRLESSTAALFYALVPNWQHFWVADAFTAGGTVPWIYVGNVALYGVLYLAGILCLGILSFRRMEIK